MRYAAATACPPPLPDAVTVPRASVIFQLPISRRFVRPLLSPWAALTSTAEINTGCSIVTIKGVGLFNTNLVIPFAIRCMVASASGFSRLKMNLPGEPTNQCTLRPPAIPQHSPVFPVRARTCATGYLHVWCRELETGFAPTCVRGCCGAGSCFGRDWISDVLASGTAEIILADRTGSVA